MIDYILMIFGGIIAVVLAIVLVAVVSCVLIPGLIIFAKKTYKFFDKLSDKMYSKIK